MESTSTEELVYVTTEDGIMHGGAIFRPASGHAKPIAIALMHGIGGSFYYPVYTAVGRELASRGYTLVSGNNRGHDFAFGPVTTISGETRLQGAGWERFSESRYDVSAWVN
jgi:predicted alpha/beta hydrolase